jgi:hypothetical protein
MKTQIIYLASKTLAQKPEIVVGKVFPWFTRQISLVFDRFPIDLKQNWKNLKGQQWNDTKVNRVFWVLIFCSVILSGYLFLGDKGLKKLINILGLDSWSMIIKLFKHTKMKVLGLRHPEWRLGEAEICMTSCLFSLLRF